MKKILTAIAILYCSFMLFGKENTRVQKFLELKKDFNYEDLYKIYTSEFESLSDKEKAVLCYSLSITHDATVEYGPVGTEYAEKALGYAEKVIQIIDNDDEKIFYYEILIFMSSRLITGPAEWMRYSGKKEKYEKALLKIDPDNSVALTFQAIDLLYIPESMGGSKKEALRRLQKIEKENPEDTNVRYTLAFYYYSQNELEKAGDYFRKVLEINPNHRGAERQLEEIELILKNPVIRRIYFEEGVALSPDRLKRKISQYEGRVYNIKNKIQIIKSLREIHAVKSVFIEPVSLENGQVDLKVSISENDFKLFAVAGFFQMNPDFNNEYAYMGGAALLYTDENFLGTGNSLFAIFAGIFLMTEYKMYSVFGDGGPFLSLGFTGLAYPIKPEMYIDGKKYDHYGSESPLCVVSAGIGRDYDIGLSYSLKNSMQLHFFDGDSSVIEPSHKYTYSASAELSFGTLMIMPSQLFLNNGFALWLNSELIYKPGYKAWGVEGSDTFYFEHDDRPALKFASSIKYFKVVNQKHNLGIDLNYQYGYNLYQSTYFEAGTGLPFVPGAEMSGYFMGELRYSHAATTSFIYRFALIENKFIPFVKHDLFYDLSEDKLYQGTAFGTALKLPYDFELNAKFGIGWDANRSEGNNGYSFQISAVRGWFL